MPNINWGSLTGSQIREVIRTWPDVPEYAVLKPSAIRAVMTPAKTTAPTAEIPTKKPTKASAKKPAKAPTKKSAAATATVTARARKHTGRDGEVKFLAHRNIWIGFAGGRAVIKRSTEQACRDALKAQFGVQDQE